MSSFWLLLTIFVLACFIGYFVVKGVSPALHSPLMSVSNAISGIIIIGAILIAGKHLPYFFLCFHYIKNFEKRQSFSGDFIYYRTKICYNKKHG